MRASCSGLSKRASEGSGDAASDAPANRSTARRATDAPPSDAARRSSVHLIIMR